MCYRLRGLAQSDYCQESRMPMQCLTWIAQSLYWWRAWILPEINLAATLNMMIGCKKIAFNRIREVYLRHFRQQPPGDRAWLVFYTWAPKLAKRRIGFRLLHDSACLYPRDRVYSVIGIIPALRDLRVRYDIDDATVLLDVYEQSEPEHIGSLKSLVENLGANLGAHGILCCIRCAKKLTPPLCEGMSRYHSRNSPKDLRIPGFFKMMLATRETSDDLKMARSYNSLKCLRCGDLNGQSDHRLRIWLIDWNLSQRTDDHHLLLQIRLDRSERDNAWYISSINRSPKSSPWWEIDGSKHSTIFHSHEVLPWVVRKNQHSSVKILF